MPLTFRDKRELESTAHVHAVFVLSLRRLLPHLRVVGIQHVRARTHTHTLDLNESLANFKSTQTWTFACPPLRIYTREWFNVGLCSFSSPPHCFLFYFHKILTRFVRCVKIRSTLHRVRDKCVFISHSKFYQNFRRRYLIRSGFKTRNVSYIFLKKFVRSKKESVYRRHIK